MAGAASGFARAVEIDPWHPAGPKALTVAADANGDITSAIGAAREAVARNPGDGASWTNLAILCAETGNRTCQAEATERAAARASFLRSELVNAAFSYEAMGMTGEADDAYRRSLLSQRLTAFAVDWPRAVSIGSRTLDEAGALVDLNRLLARWAVGEPIDPEEFADPSTRAFAHAMRGEQAQAEAWLNRAIDERPEDVPTWEAVVVLRDAWGLPIDRELRIAEAVRGGPFPPRTVPVAVPSLTFDIGSFRAYPRDQLVTGAVRLSVTDPAYPWVLAETLP
jgi:tetratricopeptide (TPR) repeat protein